jgi:mono/diheme cytochrome c family protein
MHHHGTETMMGVTDDPPGETYWKVANGIRLTGMPSYKDVLTDTQMWQVSQLLANADKPLPPAALDFLRPETTPPTPATNPPSGAK